MITERDYSLYLTNATMIYNLFRGFVKSFTMKRHMQSVGTSTFDGKWMMSLSCDKNFSHWERLSVGKVKFFSRILRERKYERRDIAQQFHTINVSRWITLEVTLQPHFIALLARS